MKKIILYMAFMAAMVSCSLYGDPSEELAPIESSGMYITVDNVTDNGADILLTPKGRANYYSYVVDESDQPEILDSVSVYSLKYSGVSQGTFKWSQEEFSTVVNLEDLKPNTTYQVYAVAGSPMGIPSSVAVKSFTTTDGVNPVLTGVDSEDNVVKLTFSEEMTYTGQPLKARFFAEYTREITVNEELGSVPVAADSIVCAGTDVLISLADIPAGAYYSIDWEEGAFTDSKGNPVAARKSGFLVDPKDPNQNLIEVGVTGQVATEPFQLDSLKAESFADFETPFVFSASEAMMAALSPKHTASVTYSLGARNVTIDLKPMADYMLAKGEKGAVLTLFLNEEPERGADVTVILPEGCMIDIFGNPNAAYSYETLYSYGYTLDQFVGDYEVITKSPYSGLVKGMWTVSLSDDEKKGDVMLTGMFGSENVFYGSLDTVLGTLAFDSPLLLSSGVDLGPDGTGSLYVGGVDASTAEMTEQFVFDLPAAGKISSRNDVMLSQWVVLDADPDKKYQLYDFFIASASIVPVE